MSAALLPFDIELAWAAGLFDGEGCADISRSRTGPEGWVYEYLRLKIGMADREPLDRFAAAVGVGNVTGPYRQDGGAQSKARAKSAWRPVYHWAVQGKKAERVANLLLPLLSPPKARQIAASRVN